jgi:hypothetical protein
VVLRRDWTGEVPEPLATRTDRLGAGARRAGAGAARPRRARPAAAPRAHHDPERALAALAARDGAEPREVRRHFLQALGARLALPAEALGSSAARVQLLRRCGVTADAARAVDALVARLDGAAFGNAHAAGARDLAGEAAALVGRVDAEACGPELPAARAARRAPGPLTARLGWLAAAVLVAGAAAAVGAGGGRSGESQPAGGERIVSRPDPRPAFARGLDAAATASGRSRRGPSVTPPRSPRALRTLGRTRPPPRGRQATPCRLPWDGTARCGSRRAPPTCAPDSRSSRPGTMAPSRASRASRPTGEPWRRSPPGGSPGWPSPPRSPGVHACAARRAPWPGAPPPPRSSPPAARRGSRGRRRCTRAPSCATRARCAPSRRSAPIPSPSRHPTDLARVDARQAAWSRVTLDGGRAGWMESSRLVPLD